MKTAEQCALGIVNEIGIKALFEPSERDYGDAANYTLDNELALDIAQTRLQAFADIHTATLREELERVRSQQHIKRLQDELSACQRERDEARNIYAALYRIHEDFSSRYADKVEQLQQMKEEMAHIRTQERERAAQIAEKYEYPYDSVCDCGEVIAAAIREK